MFVIDTALKVCYQSDVSMSCFLFTGFITLAVTMLKTSDVQYEMELALKSGGADIILDAALEHVYGYGLGLDMTRRDLQGEAKKHGRLGRL